MNRRELIVGLAAAPVLAPMAAALAAPASVGPWRLDFAALASVAKAVRDSVDGLWHDAWLAGNPGPRSLVSWAKRYADIEPKILEELADMFAVARTRGEHLVERGRLTFMAQVEVTERFPWVPSDWPPAAWGALAALVPDDLVAPAGQSDAKA